MVQEPRTTEGEDTVRVGRIVRGWRHSLTARTGIALLIAAAGVALAVAMFVVPGLNGWQRLPYSLGAGVLVGLAYQVSPAILEPRKRSPQRSVYVSAFSAAATSAVAAVVFALLLPPGWWAAGLTVAAAAFTVGLAERYPGKHVPFVFLLPVVFDALMLLQQSKAGNLTQTAVMLTLFLPALAVAVILTIWAFVVRTLPTADYAKATEVARGVLWAWILLLLGTLTWTSTGLKLGTGQQFDPLLFAIPLVTFGSVIATATTGWTRFKEAILLVDPEAPKTKEPDATGEEPEVPPHIESLIAGLTKLKSNFLRGFAPPEETPTDDPHMLSLPTPLASAGDVIELLLRVVVRARFEERYEKVQWVYRLRFEGQECSLRLGRGGLKVGFWGDIDECSRLADRMGKMLTKSLTFLHRNGLREAIDAGISAHSVEVVNQFFRYRGMVDYFLAQLEELRNAPIPEVDKSTFTVHAYETGTEEPAPDFLAEILSGIVEFQGREHRAGEVAHVATALIASYFAYIEHVTLLLAAYTTATLDNGIALTKLLEGSWAVKFDAAFAGTPSGNAKSDLSLMATRFRNPLLHGGAGRDADGMYVEILARVVALATEDGNPTDQFMLWKPSLSAEEIDWILTRIGRVDRVFETHPFWDAVSAGVASNFSPDRVAKAVDWQRRGEAEYYARAMASALDE